MIADGRTLGIGFLKYYIILASERMHAAEPKASVFPATPTFSSYNPARSGA